MLAGVHIARKRGRNPTTSTSNIWRNGHEKVKGKMQEIMWRGQLALLIQFEDTTLEGEKMLREYIEEHRDIERLIFTMNPLFIPKDLRDLAIYEKMVVVTKVPKRKPATTKSCPRCFGSGKTQMVFGDFGGEAFICDADYEPCKRCGGTGQIPISDNEDE